MAADILFQVKTTQNSVHWGSESSRGPGVNRKRTETHNVNTKRTEFFFCWSTFWSTYRGLSLVRLKGTICENTLKRYIIYISIYIKLINVKHFK